jgi:hypothetical protein
VAGLSETAVAPRALFGLDPAAYRQHPLHAGGRTYGETNCYSDILVELLHAHGDEPLAAMGFIVRMDFEGDQWTFFKPPPGDLERLFGVDIHEMQPYRFLPAQIAEQLEQGRTLIVELDSYWLPDTAATSYRTAHVKTSVAMEAIDLEGERLHYFHNASLHELSGEDYRRVLRVPEGWQGEVLPPYTELVRFDAGPRLEGEALRARARELLGEHLARRPRTNPFERFADQLEAELPRLAAGGEQDYHDYVFATLRMAGSAFDVLAAHVQWLAGDDAGAPAIEPLERIVAGCKLLSFKLARRKPFDVRPAMHDAAGAWTEAMSALDELAG